MDATYACVGEAADACCAAFNALAGCSYSRVEATSCEVRFIKEPCQGRGLAEDMRHAVEFLVATAYTFCRQFEGASSVRGLVFFPHPAVGPREEAQRLFDCTVEYEHSAAGFSMAFDAPRVEEAPSRAERRHPFLVRARQTLTEIVGRKASSPSLPELARCLAVSSRTLQRRLTALGTSYLTLADEVRLAKAQDLLRSSNCTVADIARSLGFADSVAFHRAFKRWTGLTPQRYRAAAAEADRPSTFEDERPAGKA